jgi:hypothetical protein
VIIDLNGSPRPRLPDDHGPGLVIATDVIIQIPVAKGTRRARLAAEHGPSGAIACKEYWG